MGTADMVGLIDSPPVELMDVVSSGVCGVLRLNSGDSANDDSGNILTKICVLSSGGGRSVMV